MSLSRVVAVEQTPWRWIMSGLTIGFLVFGPLSWLTYTQLPRRSVVAITTASLLGVVISVGLFEGFFDVELHALALGIYVGLFVALLTEVTVLPVEYRALILSSESY